MQMRKAPRLVAVVVVTVAMSACASPGTATPAAGDQAPPTGGPVSIDTVVLTADGRQVNVEFIGARELVPGDPCSRAYRGTARVVGDTLEIGVYAEANPATLPSGWACDMVGYRRHLTLRLDQPFTGNLVHDLAGQMLFLRPPDGLAEFGGPPGGWGLRRQDTIGGSMTPRWARIWSPQPDPWLADGSSMVTLIQSFGGPVGTTGGGPATSVEVNGQPATFYLWPPSGGMTLVWSLGNDGFALDGLLSDFTREQLIALAESVRLPPK